LDAPAETCSGGAGGPPAGQPGTWVPTGVCEQGDEDLVASQQVLQLRGAVHPVLAFPQRLGRGWTVVPGQCRVPGRQRPGHPTDRVGCPGPSTDEPIHETDLAKRVEAMPAGGGAGEEDRGDLVGGQGGVLVQQRGDGVVARTKPVGDLY